MSIAIGSDTAFAPPAVLRRVAAVQGVTIVLALVAWGGSEAESSPDGQVVWVVLASLAVVLSGAVNGVWLVRARRAIGIRKRQVAARLREVGDRHAPSALGDTGTEAAVTTVVVDGMSLYHRLDCVLAEGRRGAQTGRRSDHEAAGRRPCGWCRPGPGPGVSPS